MTRKRYDRSFNGTLICSKNYQEIKAKEGTGMLKFYKKHFKAYKEGLDRFPFGTDKYGDPVYHKLEQTLTLKD